MAENSAIEWTDATFNPWWGCSKVSPGCDHCYAERDAGRYYPRAPLWGVGAQRRFFDDGHWKKPLDWNRKAERLGIRMRVFCASMADVFDNHPAIVESHARARLWQTIRDTPHLDWQLLTKRIGNAKAMLPADWADGYANVWLGISIVNQTEADRDIPKLITTPARIRFLSCEPLLDAIDLGAFQKGTCMQCGGSGELLAGGPTTTFPEDDDGLVRCDACHDGTDDDNPGLDWVICGGESGFGARPMMKGWAISMRVQCRDAGVPFFFKQGSQANWAGFKDYAGFPTELQVRQWPGSEHIK